MNGLTVGAVMDSKESDDRIYQRHGYTSRKDYLHCLASNNGISYRTVAMLANMLGPNEDFDGLVTELADLSDMMEDK